MLKEEKYKIETSVNYKEKTEEKDIREFHNNFSNYSNKIFKNDRNIISVQGEGTFGKV